MYCDDLPVWGYIGKVEDESWEKGTKYYLFTHLLFDVLYNGNQLIEIHAFCDPNHAVDKTEIDIDVEFTYSVNWKATSTQFQNRMDKYSKASLLPVRQKIHWFSFINSIIIIVLLMGLLALLIVRRLKNDMKKFSNSDEEEDKEVGWKYIRGDVFRYPPNMSLFCAVLGVGSQLLAMMEIEADHIGILLVASAGYDPRVCPTVYEKLSKVSGGDSALRLSFNPFIWGKRELNLLAQAKIMEEALALYQDVKAGRGVEGFL